MTIDLFLTLINHLVPVFILIAILVIGIALYIGTPYCRYIHFVAESDNPKGIEDLAKYLAKKTGGRKINVDNTWESFIPAAQDLHLNHVYRRNRHTQ